MSGKTDFWDRHAKIYDRFMRRDAAAYERMYELLRPTVRRKTVLELATGTGLIAKHIISAANHIEATDASAERIAEARRDNDSSKLRFSVPPSRFAAGSSGIPRSSTCCGGESLPAS